MVRKISKIKSFVIISELLLKSSSDKNVLNCGLKLPKFFLEKIILKINNILDWKHRFSTPLNVRTRKSLIMFPLCKEKLGMEEKKENPVCFTQSSWEQAYI